MIRAPFDGNRVAVLVNSGPTRTKQSFKDECDINNIMAKYQRTGLIDAVSRIQPQYGDVVGFDFQFAMDQIVQAQEMFMELPSSWRKRFHNDPREFVEFVGNPENREEAVRLGLIVEPEAPEPVSAPSPAPVAPGSAAA